MKVLPQNVSPYQEKFDRRVNPRGRTYFWIGTSRTEEAVQGDETDVAALRDGHITVTPLHLDLNHAAAVSTLRQAYA